MTKYFRYILFAAILAVIGLSVWILIRSHQNTDEIQVLATRPGNVEEIARLCSMEIYNEVPVLDTVNDKIIFAVQKQSGSISFDIDSMKIIDSPDTLHVYLPKEIVEVYESADKNSWEVIDTKAIGPLAILRSDRLTLAEENRVKDKLKANAVRRLYTNGTIREARRNGVETLRKFLETAYRKPVIVSDTTPDGTYQPSSASHRLKT